MAQTSEHGNDQPNTTPRHRPNVTDVATLANVSIGTVSNYFNYPDRVSDLMKQRVEQAIEQLGYRRRQSETPTIKRKPIVPFIMSSVENSIYTSIFQGAQEVLNDNGMVLMAANSLTDETEQHRLIDAFLSLPVSGLLLSTSRDSSEDISRIQSHDIPVVVVDHVERTDDISCCNVAEDNTQGGYLAATHLIEQGCHTIIYAGHGFEFQPVEERYEGIGRAVRRAPSTTLEFLDSQGFLFEDGLDLGHRLSERYANHDNADHETDKQHPIGIICCSDAVANGIIEALADRIPRDFLVAGTENNTFAERGPLRLTTVNNPGEDMGRRAARLLLDEIRNPDEHIHSTVLCPPTITPRESTVR